MADDTAQVPLALRSGSIEHRISGWFGMMALIVTEASLFLYLLFSYFYFALSSETFVPAQRPKFGLSGPDTAILLLSSVAVWWGERAGRTGARGRLAGGLAAGILLGAVFIGIQLVEWAGKPFRFADSTYSALYFTITGFHLAHVAVGLCMLTLLLVWTLLGESGPRRRGAVAIGSVYWHFVDVVWLAVFFTIYVTPYLGVAR